MEIANLDHDPMLDGVLEMQRDLSRARDGREMVDAFARRFRELSGVTHVVDLDVRGLPPGEYRLMERIQVGSDAMEGEVPGRDSRRDAPEGVRATRSPLISKVIATPAPKLMRGVTAGADPVLRGFLPEAMDGLAVPVFYDGEIGEWLLVFFARGREMSPTQVRFAVTGLNLLSRSIYQVKQTAEIAALHARLAAQLDDVGRVARSILPAAPIDVPGYSIATFYEPCESAGGDYYDFRRFDDGRFGVVVADVAGHGPASAVAMAMLRTAMITDVLRNRPASAVIEDINQIMCGGLREGTFVTAVFLAIEPQTGHVVYANAGHPPPRLRAAGGQVREVGTPTCPPLGILTDLRGAGGEFEIQRGEALLLFTDGLTEARNAAGEMLGVDRLDRAFAAAPGDAEQMVRAVASGVGAHEGDASRCDDQCALVIQRH